MISILLENRLIDHEWCTSSESYKMSRHGMYLSSMNQTAGNVIPHLLFIAPTLVCDWQPSLPSLIQVKSYTDHIKSHIAEVHRLTTFVSLCNWHYFTTRKSSYSTARGLPPAAQQHCLSPDLEVGGGRGREMVPPSFCPTSRLPLPEQTNWKHYLPPYFLRGLNDNRKKPSLIKR